MEYVELVRGIAQILDAIRNALGGESDRDISTRLAKDLNDFNRCVLSLPWMRLNENLMIDPGIWRISEIRYKHNLSVVRFQG